MRTTGQIGLALFAVIALVAGVTYLSQYGPSGGRTADAGATSTPSKDTGALPEGATIGFATPKVEWTEPAEGEFEKALRGYHDFWFQNLGPTTTLIGLEFKNCKCEDAEVMVLDEKHLDNFRRWFGTSAATVLAGLQRGPLACVSLLVWEDLAVPKLFDLNLKWQGLQQGAHTGVPVPPKGGGIVRVRFEGKKDLMGPFLVKARLWAQPEGKPQLRSYGELEMPITYVAPISLTSSQVNLGTFNAKDEKTDSVMVFSTTEAGFDLYASQTSPSPLIDVQIDDLNPAEIAEYQKAAQMERRVLSAKRVKITARERLSDSQRMDLGPFYRKILLSRTKDDPDEAQLVVGGEIRGELVVGSPDDRGRIALNSFRSRGGASKTVTILAQNPELDLETKAIRIYPENLQAHMEVRLEKLKPSGAEKRHRWHLHVRLKEGFPPGKLPDGSALFLQIAGSSPPRQIRIPITGMAYQ
jgi:hypothetical protein